ncbi:MAG TPA: radical SAM protein [Thermoguttaceae bacterium]|nr:radical SAM protein [Thermoguttaceae bacterium]
MQIVLVKPCWQYPISGADHTYNRRWPPLELLNCGEILEAAGHQVRLIDAQAEDLPPDRLAQRVGSADMVLVTSSALDRWQCPTLELAPLFASIEALRGQVGTLLLTGFHGTVEPEAMLRRTGVDAVIRGEPERTIEQLAGGHAWPEILGLTFEKDGEVVSTGDRPPLEMASLPVPAFHLIDLRRYQYEVLGARFMVLEGTRGCPHACTFCSRVIQGKKLRQKSAAQLGHEVEVATKQFGIRNIYFIDLEFTASRELAQGLSHYLLDHKISVRWCCQTRTDQIDEPLLRLMKRAGCRLIHFGVETASERIAKQTRKNVTVEQQRRGVELAERVGIETLCFFLLGHPGETEEEMQQTIRLAKQLNPTYASFHRVSPYQGTPLYDQSAGNRVADSTGLFPLFAGSDEERKAIDRLVRRAIWSYYVRPRYILSRLMRGSPTSLWRQLRLFAGYFR